MEIELITFGSLTEVIKNQKIDLNEVNDTDALKTYLEHTFPALKQRKYKLALNKNLIQDKQSLHAGDTVAIMPPFSGG